MMRRPPKPVRGVRYIPGPIRADSEYAKIRKAVAAVHLLGSLADLVILFIVIHYAKRIEPFVQFLESLR